MSALYSIQEILTPTNLLDAYTKMASIHSKNPFFDFYNAKAAENVDGETFEFAVFDDTRAVAGINTRGAPARTLDAEGADKKTVTLLHAFNELTIPAHSVEFLREANSPAIQQRGMSELRRQMELFARKHATLRATSLAKAFEGNIYYDANGQVLESSSGAITTVPTGVGATHLTQLNHAAFGADIIGTAWDNAAANILTDLEQIREAAEYDKVPTPKHVWMHSRGKPWIVTNTEIKSFVSYVNPQSDEYLKFLAGQGDMLSIGDWTFHFTNATYVGADGSTVRPLIPTTKAIITPDVTDGDWFLHAEGAETIPTDDGVIGSLDEYFSNTTKVFGDFAYARIADNPLKVTVRMGMNWLYAFKDPNAVWMPTIDF